MLHTLVVILFSVLQISIIKTQNITVYQADSFVDSIGVNTHWAYTNVYTNNYTVLREKLAESGIRYVRDGANLRVYPRMSDLYDSFGIKTDLITERRKPGPWPQPLDAAQIDEVLNNIKNQTLAAIVAIEAPNEYDGSHGPDTDWVGNIRNFSMTLYTKAKADEMLKHVPVVGPSLISLEAYEAVGNSDPFMDIGNQHMYQWTYWPSFNGSDANGTRSITWFLDKLARLQSPSGKPVQATESGYTNFVDIVGLSEEADGKYMPRIFAEFFRRGVSRTYKYEFVNQGMPGREGLYGLLRNDLSEKPSFRAVKNLIHLLADKGPSFQPTAFNYVLSGSVENLRHILFQKRNGDFYLMVWLEISSWDVGKKTDLYPPSQQVTLTLQADASISNALIYAWNNTGDVNIVNLTIINNQIAFNATDKMSIIKLSNGSTASIPIGVYRLLPKNALHSSLDLHGQRNSKVVIKPQHWSNFNQHWLIQLENDGFYRLMNRGTSQVLEIEEDGVRLNDWSGSDHQKWKIDPLPNGYYHLTPKGGDNPWTANNQLWKLDWITNAIE